MEDLERKVLEMIVDKLSLEDLDLDSVDYDVPIFTSYEEDGKSLGLDSIDALELVVGLKEVFNIKLNDEDMAIFKSIRTIADFIREKTA